MFRNAIASIATTAPIASKDGPLATLPVDPWHDGPDDEAWETFDGPILNVVSAVMPPEKLDDLVKVGYNGLIRLLLFLAAITQNYETITPALYEDKVAAVVAAIHRR